MFTLLKNNLSTVVKFGVILICCLYGSYFLINLLQERTKSPPIALTPPKLVAQSSNFKSIEFKIEVPHFKNNPPEEGNVAIFDEPHTNITVTMTT